MFSKLLIGALLAPTMLLRAQTAPETKTKPITDTVKATSSKSSIKPFEQVIPATAKTKVGLFTIHKVDDKYFFEIPDSLLKREILAVTRFTKTAGNIGIYGGELANEQTIYFEKGADRKLFLRVSILINRSDSTQAIYQAVKNSNLDPIAAAFDIKAYSKNGKGTVIEVTDFFKGESQIVSVPPATKKKVGLTAIAADRSFISSINSYPINTEVKTVKTYTASGPTGFVIVGEASAGGNAGAITLEMNTSFLLLPKIPMQIRYKDDRVGYFANRFTQYDDQEQRSKGNSFIVRWRLEPRAEDLAKFKKGELVSPKKPIVYYIDPATPKKWRKYLIEGVNAWQKAFESAGFKNAIMAKEWPVNDTTMSLEDARFSVIRYFASDIANAYGPNVHDPRSGEIIESHVGWYHNVMSLIQKMYMIQAGPLDARAQKITFSDELMGELIRMVSTHEIGHTLGLRHNMGSSSQTPVEKLRDKAWVEANGHTVSIMDYARFNYVAQPEDKIGPKGIFPRIGAYDTWAIEWGYKPMLGETADSERPKLFKATTKRLIENPKLWFGGEGNPNDPRSSTEDLGDNSMLASSYGIKNLKRVVAALPKWTYEENKMQNMYFVMYSEAIKQYERYMDHVLKNIGGTYHTNKSMDEAGSLYTPVPKAIQQQALAYMDKEVFQTPNWLLDSGAINRLGLKPLASAQAFHMSAIKGILNVDVLVKIIENNNYPILEYFQDVHQIFWNDLENGKPIDVYRRSLQKLYVERVGNLAAPDIFKTNFDRKLGGIVSIAEGSTAMSDIRSIARHQLNRLKKELENALKNTTDQMTRYHYQDIIERLERGLSSK